MFRMLFYQIQFKRNLMFEILAVDFDPVLLALRKNISKIIFKKLSNKICWKYINFPESKQLLL